MKLEYQPIILFFRQSEVTFDHYVLYLCLAVIKQSKPDLFSAESDLSHPNIRQSILFSLENLGKTLPNPMFIESLIQQFNIPSNDHFFRTLYEFVKSHQSSQQALSVSYQLNRNFQRKLNVQTAPGPIRYISDNILLGMFNIFPFQSIYDPYALNGAMIENPAQPHRDTGFEIFAETADESDAVVGFLLKTLEFPNSTITFLHNNSLHGAKALPEDKKVDLVVCHPNFFDAPTQQESSSNDEALFIAQDKLPKSVSLEAKIIQLALQALNDNGTALLVVADGFLHRQGYDQQVREYLVKHKLIQAIISFPNSLYPQKMFSTSILLLNKNMPTKEIKMFDLSTLEKFPVGNSFVREIFQTIFRDRKDGISEGRYQAVEAQMILEHQCNLRPGFYVETAPADLGANLTLTDQRMESFNRFSEMHEAYKKLVTQFN